MGGWFRFRRGIRIGVVTALLVVLLVGDVMMAT